MRPRRHAPWLHGSSVRDGARGAQYRHDRCCDVNRPDALAPRRNHPEAVRYRDKIRALVDAPDFRTVPEVRAADKRKHNLMKLIDRSEW